MWLYMGIAWLSAPVGNSWAEWLAKPLTNHLFRIIRPKEKNKQINKFYIWF